MPLLPFLHGGHNVYRRVTRPLFLSVIDTARALGFTYNKGKGGDVIDSIAYLVINLNGDIGYFL